MRIVSLWLAVALAAVCGCGQSGPTRAEVRGSVHLDGQPVEEGSIRFVPAEGTSGPDAGGVIKNGEYHLPRDVGPVIGKNRVELRAFKKSQKKMQDPTAPPGTLTYARIQVFPPEYSDRSTVIKEIEAGGNRLDFDVRTGKGE